MSRNLPGGMKRLLADASEFSSQKYSVIRNSFPAQVDSVAAIIRRLAYWLLISEDAEQLNKVCAIALTQDAFNSLKGKLLKGDGNQP